MIYLNLCRFDPSGRLYSGKIDIENLPFIAISHVWGHAEWREISGVPNQVLCTPQKAKFIHDKLPHLVMQNWFWMDILCVDQSLKMARVEVVKHIPTIFRNASRTIVVREEGGLAPCCGTLLHSYKNLEDDQTWYPRNDKSNESRIQLDPEDHIDKFHSSYFKDVWMSRLWTLQELELSDTVQFTACEAIVDPRRAPRTHETSGAQIQMVLEEACGAAKIWAGRGRWLWRTSEDPHHGMETQNRLEHDFLDALLHNRTVSREPDSSADVFAVTCYETISHSIASIRETSKTRDFILAIFPRYRWYKVPEDVLNMTFQDLFQDCVRQIQGLYASIPGMRPLDAEEDAPYVRHQDVRPKITKGLVLGMNINPEHSGDANHDVPVPKTLGDFCKLLYHYHSPRSRGLELPPGSFWRIHAIGADDTIDTILHAASSTLWYVDFPVTTWSLRDYYRWKQGVDGDDAIIMLAEMDFPGEDPRDQDLMRRFSNTLRENMRKEIEMLGPVGSHEVLVEIGNIQLSARRGYAHINDLNTKTGASGSRISGNVGLSFEPGWQKLRCTVFEKDTPEFRQAILHNATHIACGLGIAGLPWTRKHLRPYLLVLSDSKGPIKDPALARQTLFFAAPNLDYDLEDEVIAYDGRNEPYVMTTSKRHGDKTPRVIGLLPQLQEQMPGGIKVYLDYGCPIVRLHEDEQGLGDIHAQ